MENKVNMIITDLNKSLLNDERQITEYSKAIFQECIKNGIIVVFATARPLRVTKIFYNSILPRAVICHNGAVAYVNDNLIYQYGIKPIIAKNLLKNIIENYSKINLALETNDRIYTNFDASSIWAGIVSEKLDVDNLPATDIDKIIIEIESIKRIKEIEKYLPEELYLEINEGKLGLIMNNGAQNGMPKKNC